MSLKLCPATENDTRRIAEIHMAAFGTNPLLHVQFPTPAIRARLQVAIEQKARDDIRDPKTSVLVVRDLSRKGKDVGIKENEQMGQIISFSKWSHPIPEGEDYTEPPWMWPEGTNLELLEKWIQKTEIAYEAAIGRTPCYHLSFIGTDPLYRRRGAASLMLQWGIERCQKEDAVAYLESTIEAAPLYRKTGFEEVGVISIALGKCSEDGSSHIYEEICFLLKKASV